MNTNFPNSQIPVSRPYEPEETSDGPWPLLPHGNLWHLSKADHGLARFRLCYPDVDNCPTPEYSLEYEGYTPTQSFSPIVSTWTRLQPFTWPVSKDEMFGRPGTGLQYFPECVILYEENARQLFTAVWALTKDRPQLRFEICKEVFMRWCWNMTREGAVKASPHLTVEELQFFETNAPHTNFYAVPPSFSADGQNMVEIYSAVTMQQPEKAQMDQMLQKVIGMKKQLAAKDEEIAALHQELGASKRLQAATERALENAHRKLDRAKDKLKWVRRVVR